MRKRVLKMAALVASGGVLLQTAGCSYLLIDQIGSIVVAQVVSALIQNLFNTASAAT